MDLDLLHTFLEVSKTRHFGKAAENLFITQSAVSARIRSLEESLNTRLFERSTKLVNLTEEGERFARHAETILLAWANAKLDISAGSDHQDLLTIGSTSGLWFYLFNQKLAVIAEKNPPLLNTLSYSTDDLGRLLFSGAIDLALMYEGIIEPSIQQVVLGNLNLRLFVHKSYLDAFQSERMPYIHVDWGDSFNQFVTQHFGDKLSLVMQSDNAQTAQHLLHSMKAVTYLPEVIARDQDELVLIDKKRAPIFKRKVYACFHADSVKKHEVKKMIKELYI